MLTVVYCELSPANNSFFPLSLDLSQSPAVSPHLNLHLFLCLLSFSTSLYLSQPLVFLPLFASCCLLSFSLWVLVEDQNSQRCLIGYSLLSDADTVLNGSQGVSAWFRDYVKILNVLFTASCSHRSKNDLIMMQNDRLQFFQSLLHISVSPITESLVASSVVITRSLGCFHICIPLAGTRQVASLLRWTSHPNMTCCHSNKAPLHRASGYYIMDGQSTQHLSPSASAPLHSVSLNLS